MRNIMDIIGDDKLQYHEKRQQLAFWAMNSLPYVSLSEIAASYLVRGIICDISEGHAPCCPRYILPDYRRYFAYGSEYLNIAPPRNLYEAINALMIIYRYVPSITGYPVYLGQLDELFEQFADTVSERELESLLRMFLVNLDRTLPDGFVHLNIGPSDTVTGRLILKLEQELKQAVPNISFKYSADTPEDFFKLAVETALIIGKPYFVNHKLLAADFGEGYGDGKLL